MPRFLIEIPHEKSKRACDQAIQIFKQTGSHLLAQADWGCQDDIHKAWLIVEVDHKTDAVNLIPPWFRDKASVVALQKFTFTSDDEGMDLH